MGISQKVKNRTTIWDNTFMPTYLSQENKHWSEVYMHIYVHSSTSDNGEDLGKKPNDRWMDKEVGAYIHSEYLCVWEEENFLFAIKCW